MEIITKQNWVQRGRKSSWETWACGAAAGPSWWWLWWYVVWQTKVLPCSWRQTCENLPNWLDQEIGIFVPPAFDILQATEGQIQKKSTWKNDSLFLFTDKHDHVTCQHECVSRSGFVYIRTAPVCLGEQLSSLSLITFPWTFPHTAQLRKQSSAFVIHHSENKEGVWYHSYAYQAVSRSAYAAGNIQSHSVNSSDSFLMIC